MSYVQGSAIDKAYQGCLEHQAAVVKAAIEEAFGSPVSIVATHADHSIVCDEKGRFQKVSYKIVDGVVEDLKIRLTRSIPVIEDEDVPAFVSKGLKKIASDMMKGKPAQRTQVREMVQLLKNDEDYWLTDVLEKIDESRKDQKWFKMYESNITQIRTSLHGRISKIEKTIPKTRYAAIAKDKLTNFESELRESLTILGQIVKGLVDETQNMVFDIDNEFYSAIQTSLIAEGQTVHGLFVKAEKLLRPDDIGRMAMAHDRLASRAKTMAIVSEHLKDRAQNDEE